MMPFRLLSTRHTGAALLLGLGAALAGTPARAGAPGHSTHTAVTPQGNDSSQDGSSAATVYNTYRDAHVLFDYVSATATLGALHAGLEGGVDKDGDSGTLGALASFTDTIFVTSTDPSVTNATLLITPRLDGTVTVPTVNALDYPVFNSYADFNVACDSAGTDIFDSRNNGGKDQSYNGGPISLIVPVNTGIFLSASLYLQGSIAGGDGVGGSLMENFGDTAHVFVDSLTPGTVVSSEGGTSYASPTPEPPAFAGLTLGVLGLAGLALQARRRRAARPRLTPKPRRDGVTPDEDGGDVPDVHCPRHITGEKTMPSLKLMRLMTLLGLPLLAPAILATAPACYAQDASAPASPLAGVALPRGAQRQDDAGLSSGMGKLLADGAKEFKLPPRHGGAGDAEVYFFTGSAYKEDRFPFMKTMLQSALSQAGYVYTEVDSTVDNTPNAFQDDEYNTGSLHLAPFDGRHAYFHATDTQKGRTLVGVWIPQPSQGRAVLALSLAGFEAPVETKVPGISDSNVWLVKDFKHAAQGMPTAPLPAFPKIAAKPGAVRGVVEDGAGRPLAGAHIIAECSAGGGFLTPHGGRTNAKGVYEIPLPIGIGHVANADCRVAYNGKEYLLPLHPADGERDEFDSRAGHVENFVLRTSGAAGPEGHSYGATIRVLDWNVPETGTIELTLKPVGPLLDGSAGRTMVFRYKAKGELGGEQFLGDVPIGHYTLTAKVYDGEDSLPLRVQRTFTDDGDNPLGPSLDVVFSSLDTELANLGGSNIKRYDVTVKP